MSTLKKQYNSTYYTDIDIFNSYDNPHKIDKNTFLLILRTFMVLFVKSMVEEGKVYTLPYFLGVLGVRKRKPAKPVYVDYGHYRKTGEKRMHLNFHSNGYIARFKWNKPDLRLPGSTPYKFLLCQDFQASRQTVRYLAKQIREQNTINKYYD